MDHQARFINIPSNPCPKGAMFGWLKRGDVRLRYALWREVPSDAGLRKGTVIFIPGRTEFIEKYFEVVGELQQRGYAVAALDVRGQGFSSRLITDKVKGHVESFQDYVDDLHAWMEEVVVTTCDGPYYLLGLSMGGHICLRYLHDHPERISKTVTVAAMTALKSWPLSASFGKALIGLGHQLFGPTWGMPGGARANPAATPFKLNLLTRDKRRFMRTKKIMHTEPKLIVGVPTFGWLRAAIDSMELLNEADYVRNITSPVLIVIAGEDHLIDTTHQIRVAQLLPKGKRVIISGSRHEILVETDDKRAQFWQAFDAFMSED